jgi:dTDP-4-amino-4,6-dideoxygalactose transaminase
MNASAILPDKGEMIACVDTRTRGPLMAHLPIPFNVPFRTETEGRHMNQLLASSGFGGDGPFARRCQAEIERFCGSGKAYLTTSCTAALEMAAMLVNLGPGDDFLVPSYTFVASASAFMRNGARPIFVEVDEATMMIDLDDARRRLTPATKAIVPVHYAGIPCDIEGVMAFAAEHNLLVIEDAAQGYDARLDGRHLGTFGVAGTFSFHETKNLHCGLGGALLVNDPALIDRADALWQRGTDRTRMLRGAVDKYTWITVGSSFYPTEFQAAYLLDQLEHAATSTGARARVEAEYREGLRELLQGGRLRAQELNPRATSNHHCFYVLLPTNEEREGLRIWLQERRISAYTHYVPLHSSPMGLSLGNRVDDLVRTEELAGRLLRLPMYASMTTEETAVVCQAINDWAARWHLPG